MRTKHALWMIWFVAIGLVFAGCEAAKEDKKEDTATTPAETPTTSTLFGYEVDVHNLTDEDVRAAEVTRLSTGAVTKYRDLISGTEQTGTGTFGTTSHSQVFKLTGSLLSAGPAYVVSDVTGDHMAFGQILRTANDNIADFAAFQKGTTPASFPVANGGTDILATNLTGTFSGILITLDSTSQTPTITTGHTLTVNAGTPNALALTGTLGGTAYVGLGLNSQTANTDLTRSDEFGIFLGQSDDGTTTRQFLVLPTADGTAFTLAFCTYLTDTQCGEISGPDHLVKPEQYTFGLFTRTAAGDATTTAFGYEVDTHNMDDEHVSAYEITFASDGTFIAAENFFTDEQGAGAGTLGETDHEQVFELTGTLFDAGPAYLVKDPTGEYMALGQIVATASDKFASFIHLRNSATPADFPAADGDTAYDDTILYNDFTGILISFNADGTINQIFDSSQTLTISGIGPDSQITLGGTLEPTNVGALTLDAAGTSLTLSEEIGVFLGEDNTDEITHFGYMLLPSNDGLAFTLVVCSYPADTKCEAPDGDSFTVDPTRYHFGLFWRNEEVPVSQP